MFIKCSLNQRRKILSRKVVIRLCSSICLSLNLLQWCRTSDCQRETEWTHVGLVPSFVDSRETSHIASLWVKGSVCLSCISRRSLFDWIRSPVPCLGLSLQPPSAPHSYLACHPKSTEGEWTACWVLLAQRRSRPTYKPLRMMPNEEACT